MQKFFYLNLEQKKVLSSFFGTLAAAWFIAMFITPGFITFDWLNFFRYFVSMIVSIFLSLFFVKE